MSWFVTKIGEYFSQFFPRKTATVTFTFSTLVLFIAAAMGVATIVSNSNSRVQMQATSTYFLTNETHEVVVYVEAVNPVNAVSLEISLPNNLELMGVNRGSSVLSLWTEDPYEKNGIVHLSGGTFQRGFIGKHQIATLLIKTAVPGNYSLSLSKVELFAGDGTGSAVPVANNSTLSLMVYEKTDEPKTNIEHLRKVADLDGDGNIGLRDVSIFMSSWTSGGKIFDFDGDGRMTFRDFSILLTLAYR